MTENGVSLEKAIAERVNCILKIQLFEEVLKEEIDFQKEQ